MQMSIGSAARYLGVSVVTLRRWDREGVLRPSWRTPGGHRRYNLSDLRSFQGDAGEDQEERTVTYARVSSHDQKDDLERQAERLKRYCLERGWIDLEVIQDLGSGLNYRKRGLRKLLRLICQKRIGRLVIQCKDRLLRFGAEIILELCRTFGIRVEMIDPPEEDFEGRLAADVIELMTVFSARLHGSRAHRNRRCAA